MIELKAIGEMTYKHPRKQKSSGGHMQLQTSNRTRAAYNLFALVSIEQYAKRKKTRTTTIIHRTVFEVNCRQRDGKSARDENEDEEDKLWVV